MIFILWHVFMNSEDLDRVSYSSNWMNTTLWSWFLNLVTSHFIISRGRCFLPGVSPQGYEVEEHIATKVKINPRIISTLKNAKCIFSMNRRKLFETSMVEPLVILVALVRKQTGKGFSKSRIFVGKPSISPFRSFHFILETEKLPNQWWIRWESFLNKAQTVGTTIFLFLCGLNL